MATVASPTVPTSKHAKIVVVPRARNAPYSLSSFTSTRAALVLACGAWREEREVKDNMELLEKTRTVESSMEKTRARARVARSEAIQGLDGAGGQGLDCRSGGRRRACGRRWQSNAKRKETHIIDQIFFLGNYWRWTVF
jgi:hypothetical protein